MSIDQVDNFIKEVSELNASFKHELKEGDTVEKHIVFLGYPNGFGNFGFKDDPQFPEHLKVKIQTIFDKHFPKF